MSYILEALNKSEQERRGKATPDLNTVHRPPPESSKRSLAWVWVIIAFALLNGLALAWWLTSESSGEKVGKQPAPQPTARVAQPVTPTTKPEPTVQETPAPTSVALEPVVITPDTINRPPVTPVRITELPVNVQRQIPNLVFSSHLFSDDPGFRMVNINGKMIREGDIIASDLKLIEITEEGVVLGYRHYVFEVSVLRDWSFN